MTGSLVDILLWLVAVEVLSLAFLPLTLRLLFGLPDGGYASSKMLGLLLVGYVAWLTGILGFTSFTGPTLVIITALVGVVAWVLWGRELRGAWPAIRPLAIGAEATFVVVFLLAAVVRAFNAPIAGQEKQMDMTFLNSLIQTRSLPAPDLWLSGYGMPYYYFGYLLQSLLGKVLPIDPSVSYNLAVAMVLALAATAAFGIAASLVKLGGGRTWAATTLGVFGAFALTIMGNMEALFEAIAGHDVGSAGFWAAMGIKGLQANSGGFPPADGGWWFRAARVIPNIQPDGINEFPYFSFLLGDLHPHYMAIPLALLICTFACHELVTARTLRADPLRLGVTAVVLGAVVPSNTWDVPIFWGVFALALLASALRETDVTAALLVRAKDLGAVVLLAVVGYLPYFVGYVSQPLGLAVVDERTMFGSFFVLFGPLVILALAGGAIGLIAASDARDSSRRLGALLALAVGVVVGVVLVGLRQPTLGFLVAALVFWIALTLLRATGNSTAEQVATGILVIAGLGSVLIPELVYLKDLFGTRMNTVFKFYYDAWILLAVAAPLNVWELVAAARGKRAVEAAEAEPPTNEEIGATVAPAARPLAALSLVAVGLFVLGGCIYPAAATMTKSSTALGGPTLDGMLYLRRMRADDAAAIDWLRRTRPTGGVVEAAGDDYSDAGRFSTFGGVATLVGWGGHEVQWRGTIPAVEDRRALARRVYTSADPGALRTELAQANMQYIVLGGLERDVYGPSAGSGLDDAFPVVQQFGNTKIYEVAGRS